MRVLVTGSSGWLGQTLVPKLRREGHDVIGIDPLPSANTHVVGSIVDRELVRTTMRDFAITAVVHAGALHKPQVATHASSDFISVNVEGTLNLLEAAVEPHATVERLVFTSTTSVMISHAISTARRNARGVDHRSHGPAPSSQYLWDLQARRRAPLPAVS